MSFFREIAQEFRNEFEKATAEFAPQSLAKDFRGQSKPIAPHAANPYQQAVTQHAPGASSQQRPQANKQSKRSPQQGSRQSGQQTGRQTSTAEQTQVRTVSPVRAHQLVANLNPITARSAIIMSEVLGPPVSKRQRKTWR